VSQSSAKIRSQSVYLLPNLFTLGGFFAAFYAVIAAMHGRYEHAAIAILLAMVMDGLDGAVARLVDAASEFGKQLDSLADIVSFGLTPAIVVYSWSLQYLGKIGWLVAFLYAACSALRLARFNIQPSSKHFQGLSTTMAAGFVATGVWASSQAPFWGQSHPWVVMIAVIVLSVLKVSTVRYESLKGVGLGRKLPFFAVLVLLVALVLVALDPPDVLFLIAFLYVLSGPTIVLWNLFAARFWARGVITYDKEEG